MIKMKRKLGKSSIINHLFSSNFYDKRFYARFCEAHDYMNQCTCSLEFFVKSKYCDGIHKVLERDNKSDDQLLIDMALYLESHYRFEESMYKYSRQVSEISKANASIMLSTAANQIDITSHMGVMRSMPINVELAKGYIQLRDAYKQWDRQTFSTCTDDTFFRSRPTPQGPIRRLKSIVEQRFSAYNMSYGYNEEGLLRSVQARDNLYRNGKLSKLHREFDTRTDKLNPSAQRMLVRYQTRALRQLYEWLGTREYFGKYGWHYSEDAYKETVDVKLISSSGLSTIKSVTIYLGDAEFVVGPSGYKKEYMEQFFTEMQRICDLCYEGKAPISIPRDACNIIMKVEVHNDWEKLTKEGREKIRNKCRHFFIPHCFTNLVAASVIKLRQGLERGDMIRIGMKWWQAGAEEIARILKYDPVKYPDQCFSIGDFEKIDKTIKRYFLNLYSAEGYRYMSDKFVGPQREFFDLLMKYTAESLGVKVVHMVGGKWVVMNGVMPSGHGDTSHGDSWVVSFLFSLFVTTQLDGAYGAKIRQYLREGRIKIIVYGDDFVISVPRDVYHVLGSSAFSRFVALFDMTIRDDKEVPFLSVPGQYGELIVEGVSFLQRYFIDVSYVEQTVPGMPKIVPYRPAHKNIIKLAFGSGTERAPIDIIFACIGHAYDTMGTNIYAYDFVKHIYYKCLDWAKLNHDDPSAELMEFLKQTDEWRRQDITSLMQKSNLDMEDAVRFPSLRNLQSRHIMIDPNYHDIQLDLSDMGLFTRV